MEKKTLQLTGGLLVLLGILSFLLPVVPHWLTLLILVVGAATTVYSTWFREE